MLALIGPLGPTELLVIGGIALLIFGNRLPSVARSAGKSINEFKKGMTEMEEEVKQAVESKPAGDDKADPRV